MNRQRQLRAVKRALLDGRWRTPEEIADRSGLMLTAGVTARIRDLRKDRFGGHIVRCRPRVGRPGSHEYRLIQAKP